MNGKTPSLSTAFGNYQVSARQRASGRFFLRCAGPVKRGPCHPPRPVPRRIRQLPRTLCSARSGGTRRCPSQCSGTIGTHTGTTPGPHTGYRARRCASAPPPRMASQDSHERPVPRAHAPHLRSVAHTAHAPAPHITEVRSPSRREDGAAEVPQSDEMEVDLATEVRPHAHPPARPPAPPASLPGLLRAQRRMSPSTR